VHRRERKGGNAQRHNTHLGSLTAHPLLSRTANRSVRYWEQNTGPKLGSPPEEISAARFMDPEFPKTLRKPARKQNFPSQLNGISAVAISEPWKQLSGF